MSGGVTIVAEDLTMKRHVDKIAFVLMLPFAFQSSLAQAESCAETLKRVEFLYNNIVDECRNPDGSPDPLTDCSGLIVRGAARPQSWEKNAWYIWNPDPSKAELGTTTASWMRSDVNFLSGRSGFRSGYILTPVDLVPADEPKSHIACIAPVSFDSDGRRDRGCGDFVFTAEEEKSCDAIGVTGANWKSKEYPLAQFQARRLCTFYMKRGHDRVAAAKDFVLARKSIQDTELARESPTELLFYHPTELNTQSVLAFFCTDSASCRDARLNQNEYKKIVNKDRNIIWISFPNSPARPATFTCDPS